MVSYKAVVLGFAKGIASIAIFWALSLYLLPVLSTYLTVNSLDHLLTYGIILGSVFVVSSFFEGDRLEGIADIVWGVASMFILLLAFPKGVFQIAFSSPTSGSLILKINLLPALLIVFIIPLIEISKGVVSIINSQRHINTSLKE